ncbi:MAG TPA: alginate export family protein [Geobacteraceae bacterium]|nr:alginate export family protein [Geobacteraceae bacterium]
MPRKMLVMLSISVMAAGTALAHEDDVKKGEAALAAENPGDGSEQRIPEKVTIKHWSCREIAELGKKYEATKKLPEAVVVEGKPCPRSDLAGCLLSILDKVMDKCGKEGADAIPREDLDRLAALHEALKPELARYPAYLVRREAIEAMLAKPEVPEFEYKVGVNGFLRGEGVRNFRLPDFSYAAGHGEGRFLYRVKPYAYWHPTDYLDIHVEGQGYGFTGGSQNSGKYSLYQGFVEGKIPEKDWLALKVGRQEFNYGSAFILGPDSLYNGLSFDAARLRVQPLSPLAVDLLGGFYATPFSDGLKGYLAGTYATYTFSEGNAVEAYAFRDTGSPNRHAGEHLDTWGLRGTARLGPVSLEIEPVYESGRVFNSTSSADDNISAYGGHLDATVETDLAGHKNKFFASYAYGSGSRDAANQVSSRGEFRTPDNDSSLVGDMSVIGDMSGITVNSHHASGLQIGTLGWGIDVTREVNFSATGRYFLANNVENGFSRHLGLETDFTLTYAMSDNLSLVAGYDRFFTDGFFRNASGIGKDIDYGYVMLQFDLARTKLKTAKM